MGHRNAVSSFAGRAGTCRVFCSRAAESDDATSTATAPAIQVRIMALPVRARRVAFVRARLGAGKFVSPRSRIPGNVQARVVVDPVDQAVLEYRIRSRDSLRNRQRVA